MNSHLAVRQERAEAREQLGDPDQFRLTLLGGFSLAERGRDVMPPLGAQRLLAFLALQRQPQPRTRVAGTLWPDGTDAQSSANLRSTLWRLRRPGFSLVQTTYDHLSLAHGLAVDVCEVNAMVRRLQNPAATCCAEDLDPARLADELLPTWSTDDWILVERERLRQLCLHGLEAMCERLLALRRYGEAVQAGLRLCGPSRSVRARTGR